MMSVIASGRGSARGCGLKNFMLGSRALAARTIIFWTFELAVFVTDVWKFLRCCCLDLVKRKRVESRLAFTLQDGADQTGWNLAALWLSVPVTCTKI